jgi:osmoprotectant transport system substrate-binding protein
VIVIAFGWCVTGCGTTPRSAPASSEPGAVRVGSFNFEESQLLGEIYATELEARGFTVRRLLGLGSREVVEPALEQHLVDLVPEYLGTSLDFVAGGSRRATADTAENYAELRRRFAELGVTVLRYAPAKDSNGFVVSRETADRHGLRRVSDLAPVASGFVLGGPAECAERPLCMIGLRDVYGLHFQRFTPLTGESVIADALHTGEIDVGVLDTTSGVLAGGELMLLDDDRSLQPAENVVPVANSTVVRRLGPRFVDAINAVSAHLDTAALVALNRADENGDRSKHAIALDWLRRTGLL